VPPLDVETTQPWETFEYGFWHPFGQHGRETPSDIINRKCREIERNGWTLWSFQYRTPERHREMSGVRGSVFVFCSRGRQVLIQIWMGVRQSTADTTSLSEGIIGNPCQAVSVFLPLQSGQNIRISLRSGSRTLPHPPLQSFACTVV
jgi:hypothetical protein